jgi:hypothetical protein
MDLTYYGQCSDLNPSIINKIFKVQTEKTNPHNECTVESPSSANSTIKKLMKDYKESPSHVKEMEEIKIISKLSISDKSEQSPNLSSIIQKQNRNDSTQTDDIPDIKIISPDLTEELEKKNSIIESVTQEIELLKNTMATLQKENDEQKNQIISATNQIEEIQSSFQKEKVS